VASCSEDQNLKVVWITPPRPLKALVVVALAVELAMLEP